MWDAVEAVAAVLQVVLVWLAYRHARKYKN
jgi:hypothetical protein